MVSNAPAKSAANGEASAWSSLRLPVFRLLWIATLVSNIGTWMHDVGAGWLMTSLSPSPIMVALVQTATTLPIFVLAMPGGAMADIIDRRRYLIAVQAWMVLVAMLLGVLTLMDMTTAWMLVALTFAMGVGTAMMMPAWAAVTPEIVPRQQLQSAIALNSLGINVARAIGPALAGVIVSFAGTGAVFVLNAVSYLGVLIVLIRWQRDVTASRLPVERFFVALRAGIRFARHAPPLQAAAFRGMSFFLFASATWALLPLVARGLVGGGPQTFGLLVASLGAGAVVGALLLPALRARWSRDIMVAGAAVVYAVATLAIARLDAVGWLCLALGASGMAWIAVLSSLQVAAQVALPDWVRSRGLAVFMTVFMGSMAAGSLAWGTVADMTSIATALTGAGLCLLASSVVGLRWRIGGLEDIDLSPSMHWPEPEARDDVALYRGPVLVTIEYVVRADETRAFLAALYSLGEHRRRDGALAWGVYEDTNRPHHFIESFQIDSWLEHLRQHERVTNTDRALQQAIASLLVQGTSPTIHHFVAAEVPGREVHR